ncbi:guanine nucleotide-binding protein subunit gamma 3-like isoform X2 [Quercus robur]|nr:guanine nucleotide-binding protein subunit gamma 3-like isoform X2 [Quercus robur]
MTMRPESPSHGGFDLYGKRRLVLKVHAMEREIGLLEEELKSLEGMQPASICCQELDTYIVAKPDPFIAKNQDIQKSHHFWKRIWAKCCLNLPWICCFSGCQIRLKLPNLCIGCRPCKFQWPGCCCFKKISCQTCCNCLKNSCIPCSCCCFKKISCQTCCNCLKNSCLPCSCGCFKKISCQTCCNCLKNSCLPCSCCCFKRCSCKCRKVNLCSGCPTYSCNPCNLCCCNPCNPCNLCCCC